MSVAALRDALPAYAKDLRLNLGSVVTTSPLTEQQLWGALVACAMAGRSPRVIAEVSAEAAGRLSPEAFQAARAAAALMAMTNVYYRTMHLIGDDAYAALPARLRMTVLGDPGVDRADFELWSLAVSAVNGCGRCLESHEKALRTAGVPREHVQETVRLAAIISAVGVTLDAEAAVAAV